MVTVVPARPLRLWAFVAWVALATRGAFGIGRVLTLEVNVELIQECLPIIPVTAELPSEGVSALFEIDLGDPVSDVSRERGSCGVPRSPLSATVGALPATLTAKERAHLLDGLLAVLSLRVRHRVVTLSRVRKQVREHTDRLREKRRISPGRAPNRARALYLSGAAYFNLGLGLGCVEDSGSGSAHERSIPNRTDKVKAILTEAPSVKFLPGKL